MNRLCVLILIAAPGFAAQFTTGQAARAVIGQRTFTDASYGASEKLLGGVSGIAVANDMLFVTDANRVGSLPLNHRVLIYQGISSKLPHLTDELFWTSDCPVCTGSADVVVGQPDFSKVELGLSRTALRLPTAVATDGSRLVIADTDNNRVLIWNSIPTSNDQPADVVVGQPDFNSNSIPPNNTPNNKSLRGPQGVWIQNNKLFIADTQNHRVLIFNSIPSSNGAAADVVVGQPDFNTFVEPNIAITDVTPRDNNLLNPVSVTSDGTRMYITDLGHNRVLIWNSIPTSNQAPADIVLGQPDFTSAIVNNTEKMCESNGTDEDGNPTYPVRCAGTMDFPRFALSDGEKLFIADGGNDRVLIYNRIPTRSAEFPDVILGQIDSRINTSSLSTDSLKAPMSLAWDGTNLYVTDSFNRRIMIYSPAEPDIPYTGVRNSAALDIFAVGGVTFGGTLTEGNEVTITINDRDYEYKIVANDTIENLINTLVETINADDGDPDVLASPNVDFAQIVLRARLRGEDGNSVTIAATVSTNATIQVQTTGATLSGGGDAAQIAPGTIVTILGDNLSEGTAAVPAGDQQLPTTLANTQVYFDGVRAPLMYVSPTQINAQIPWEMGDRTSVTGFVRSVRSDGSIRVTTPVAVTVVGWNPGIFAVPGDEPRQAVAMHGSPYATGTIAVDGSVNAGDVGTVKIEDRTYNYTVKEGDTLATIRDAFVNLINSNPDERVVATRAATTFTRIRLRAKILGDAGLGLAYSASVPEGASLLLTALSNSLCCANFGPVTDQNPALPGEVITVYATGLGLSQPRGEITGEAYQGPDTDPIEFVSSLAGGRTAQVLKASMKQGTVGIYEVDLELNSGLPTNPQTQLTIAQTTFVSNIVTIPVFNPAPETTAAASSRTQAVSPGGAATSSAGASERPFGDRLATGAARPEGAVEKPSVRGHSIRVGPVRKPGSPGISQN